MVEVRTCDDREDSPRSAGHLHWPWRDCARAVSRSRATLRRSTHVGKPCSALRVDRARVWETHRLRVSGLRNFYTCPTFGSVHSKTEKQGNSLASWTLPSQGWNGARARVRASLEEPVLSTPETPKLSQGALTCHV